MVTCNQCGDEVAPKRHQLGYTTCLSCGDRQAREVRFCVVNMHKSNYTVVSNPDELKGLNKYAQG